jgi:GTPase SAR1 family protein
MLRLFDTAGKEEYGRLRPFDYPQTNVFLVFTRIGVASTYRHAEELWIPEITRHCPGVPFIVVGIKGHDDHKALKRARTWKSPHPRSAYANVGKDLARRLGAVCYYECSVLEGRVIDYVVEQVRIF